MRIPVLLGLLLLLNSSHMLAQCSFPSGTPANGTCVATQATNGQTINSGQTVSFTGAGGNFSSLNINTGGTLQVCGSLTISSLNYNGGNIVVMSGGSLTIGSSININTNCIFTNYGTTTFNGAVSVQGSPSALINASSAAVMNFGSNTLTVSSSFINLGSATLGQLSINSAGTICQGPGAALATTSVTNNATNSFTVSPAGAQACLSFSGNSHLNNALTASSNLVVCKAAGATQTGAGGFGSATVVTNCSGCGNVILPITISAFSASVSPASQCTLSWTTATEENEAGFAIEQSQNGQSFDQVGFVNANNVPSTYSFSWPITGNSYFRLRIQDRDGNSSYSKILYVSNSQPLQESLGLFPNPSTGDQLTVKITSLTAQEGELIIDDISGILIRKINTQLVQGQNNIFVSASNLAAGIYSVYFISNKKRIGPVKWVKQ